MEAGWKAGAGDVEHLYREPYDRLFLGRYASDERLKRSSFTNLAAVDRMAEGQRACVIVDGEANPEMYDEIDPERFARIAPLEFRQQWGRLLGKRGVAWTVIPFPTAAWAMRIFGEPDVPRLRDVIAHATRLDEADPIAAWQTHGADLMQRAEWLTRREYDGIRFRGPQTDLYVGLLPTARWGGFQMKTAWGQSFCPNIPTEEIATTPDCRRTHGVVTTTVPFADVGAYVTNASFRFEEGRIVSASAAEGEPWLLQMLKTDPGASTLGELALVPAGNRLSALGLIYFHGLFDENVASHIAVGNSYTETVPGADAMTEAEREAAGMSISSVHYDFMIGGPEVDVFGVRKDGSEEPIMLRGRWQLEPSL
jgi:aminopeptidase